jgi:hypothetical protein
MAVVTYTRAETALGSACCPSEDVRVDLLSALDELTTVEVGLAETSRASNVAGLSVSRRRCVHALSGTAAVQ